MPKCCIKYTASSIIAEYEPGCANFSYWLYDKVQTPRWSRTGSGIWLCAEVNEAEAKYIEKLALAQFGECEVIGKPAPAVPTVTLLKRPAPDGQLSLF